MATKRQREHSMIVASEKLVKRVNRDCDRHSTRRHKWSFWSDPHPTKPKRRKLHKQLTRTEHNERWFWASAGRLNHLSKRELGLLRNYRLKAIRKSKGR